MAKSRVLLPRTKKVKVPGYLAETARQANPYAQRFCLPPWEVSRLWITGWQPFVEKRTDGGLLEGLALKLKPLVIPVMMAVTQMQQEAS